MEDEREQACEGPECLEHALAGFEDSFRKGWPLASTVSPPPPPSSGPGCAARWSVAGERASGSHLRYHTDERPFRFYPCWFYYYYY